MVVKPEKHRDRLPVGELHKLVTLEVSEFARLCSQKVAGKKWREFPLRGKAPHVGCECYLFDELVETQVGKG